MTYSLFIFEQLDDLPDFLSGEEQHNTVHIQICFKRPVSTKDRKKKTHFLKKSPKERSDQHGRRPNSPLPLSPGQSSPHLGAVQSSPHLEVVKSLPVLGAGGRSPQLHPHHVGVSRTTSQHRSPPGQEYLTLSDLAVTQHHNHTARSPGQQATKSRGLDYDDESPLQERSSSLQEIAIPTVKVRKRKVEYSPSTKLGSENSSDGSWGRSASMRQLTSDSHLSVTGFLSSEDRTVSQPDLCSGGSPTSARKLGQLHKAISSDSVHTGNLNGSNTSLHKELDGNSVEISIIDIYVLKQVTDFYYYLKALWNNANIVSPKGFFSYTESNNNNFPSTESNIAE